MTNAKKPADAGAKKTEEETEGAAAPAVVAQDETPSPTQAEMDEAKLNLTRAGAYLTREAKSE
jgi:hypothetical protein